MEESMKNYELLLIFPTSLEEGDLDKIKNEISNIIQSLEGTISFKELTKRMLAYPINKEKQGLYLTSRISINPEKLIKLSQEFKTKKQILRHLITKLESEAGSGKEISAPRKITQKPTEKIKRSKEKIAPEKTLEEIDKKLEEIIGEI